jgi:DNA mismatch endonuclease (patch repair protein)
MLNFIGTFPRSLKPTFRVIQMVDRVSSLKRSEIMRAVPTVGTTPELALRTILDTFGIAYESNVAELLGKPDLVVPSMRLAILVNGCFWHGHSGCRKGRTLKSNVMFWSAKVARNRKRDRLVSGRLRRLGYSVHTVWECQLKRRSLPMRLATRLGLNDR